MQATDNSYHVLKYNYVPDILDKRGPYREAHLAGAKKMVIIIIISSHFAAVTAAVI